MSQQENEKAENLRELLRQHWLHCRHLENERTVFLIAYIGSIASILGFVFFKTGLEWTIAVPILLTVLALLLTKRWSDAFEHHRKTVSELTKILWLESAGEAPLDPTMNITARNIYRVFKTRHMFYSFYLVILGALIILLAASLTHPELFKVD